MSGISKVLVLVAFILQSLSHLHEDNWLKAGKRYGNDGPFNLHQIATALDVLHVVLALLQIFGDLTRSEKEGLELAEKVIHLLNCLLKGCGCMWHMRLLNPKQNIEFIMACCGLSFFSALANGTYILFWACTN